MGQGAAEHAAARGVGVEALDDVLGDERVEQVPALPPRHITLLYDIIKALRPSTTFWGRICTANGHSAARIDVVAADVIDIIAISITTTTTTTTTTIITP